MLLLEIDIVTRSFVIAPLEVLDISMLNIVIMVSISIWTHYSCYVSKNNLSCNMMKVTLIVSTAEAIK